MIVITFFLVEMFVQSEILNKSLYYDFITEDN